MSLENLVAATTHTHIAGQITDFDDAVSANADVAANSVARQNDPQDNASASAAPQPTDDSSQGYSVGSRWIVSPSSRAFVCTNAAVGAAVWPETTNSDTHVFSASDTIGGVSLTSGFVPIPWDNVYWIDTTTFTHTPGSSDITIGGSSSVLLEITADVSTINTVSILSGCAIRLMIDSGSGFVEQQGSRAYTYNSASGASRDTASVNTTAVLNPTDKLRIEASVYFGLGVVETRANGSRLVIKTIKNV